MRIVLEIILFGIILNSWTSCETKTQSGKENSNEIVPNKTSTEKDSFKIAESKNQIDNPINEYMKVQLNPIRENFKRLNSIDDRNWSSIVTKEFDGTNEGGEVTYYHRNAELDIIVVKEYGQTFQVLSEYFFLHRSISFVFEKAYKYNRPVYLDSIAMMEMNDNKIVDISKADIVEERNYFDKGKLIHQLSSVGDGSRMAKEYLCTEQKRILSKMNRILKLEKAL
jgi:hypothetical protein